VRVRVRVRVSYLVSGGPGARHAAAANMVNQSGWAYLRRLWKAQAGARWSISVVPHPCPAPRRSAPGIDERGAMQNRHHLASANGYVMKTASSGRSGLIYRYSGPGA
jgi:hypothetical protein